MPIRSTQMKMHLITLHQSLWEVVNVGVRMPKSEEEMTPEIMVDLHRNAQATSVILSSLRQEEFNKVNGLEVAKDIWDTLQVSHEGDHKAKLSKIELLEGELEEFVMLKGETLQGLFDGLMIIINKMSALGCEDWDDHKVTRRFLRAYQVKNMGLAQMIRDRDDYDEMKPHTLLGKLQQHEMADQAAIKAAGRVPNAIMPNIVGGSKGVALKAKHEDEHNNQVKSRSNKSSKSKDVVDESSTSEDDSLNDEDQDVAMFIKSFKRIIKGGNKFRRNFGDKQKRRNKKRPCYECGEIGYFIAECPKKKNEGKKEWRKDKYKKEEKNKGYKNKKYHGHAHVGEEWDSEDESSSSEEEGVANITIQTTSPASLLFTNLTDDESNHVPFCLMEKGKKVPTETSSSSDDDKDILIKEFCMKGYKVIKTLMEKLEKKEISLELQEDLLILEKERK